LGTTGTIQRNADGANAQAHWREKIEEIEGRKKETREMREKRKKEKERGCD